MSIRTHHEQDGRVSTERVQAFLDDRLPGARVVEPDVDTPTAQAAADALGVEPGQIAKTLALRAGDRLVLVVARGDGRLDDAEFKARFGAERGCRPTRRPTQ